MDESSVKKIVESMLDKERSGCIIMLVKIVIAIMTGLVIGTVIGLYGVCWPTSDGIWIIGGPENFERAKTIQQGRMRWLLDIEDKK